MSVLFILHRQKKCNKYKAMNKTWRVQNTYLLDDNGVPQITYGRIFIRYTNQWIANHPEDFKGGQA